MKKRDVGLEEELTRDGWMAKRILTMHSSCGLGGKKAMGSFNNS